MATDNLYLISLISELKKKSIDDGTKIWKRIAVDLERPTRQRRVVNIARIDRYTEEKETIVVPGKVLAAGELTHPVNVAAFTFSQQAKEKIQKAKGTTMTINELMQKQPKEVRIIG